MAEIIKWRNTSLILYPSPGRKEGHMAIFQTWKLPKGKYKIYIFFFANGPIILHQSSHSCLGNQELYHISMLFYRFWTFWATFTSAFPSNKSHGKTFDICLFGIEVLFATDCHCFRYRTRISFCFSIGSSSTHMLGLNTKSGWQHLW